MGGGEGRGDDVIFFSTQHAKIVKKNNFCKSKKKSIDNNYVTPSTNSELLYLRISISVHNFYCVWNYIPKDHKIDSAHHDFIFVFIMEFTVQWLFYFFLITYTYSQHYTLIMFISTRFISHPDNLLSHFNHLQKVRNPLKNKNRKS